MTDPHQRVINNICEVICRETIVFQDNLVIDHAIVKHNFAMDIIFEHSLSFRHLHSDHVGLSVCYFFLDLFLGIAMKTKPIVFGFCILLASNLDTHLFESLCGAEAMICISILNQSVNVFVVDR